MSVDFEPWMKQKFYWSVAKPFQWAQIGPPYGPQKWGWDTGTFDDIYTFGESSMCLGYPLYFCRYAFLWEYISLGLKTIRRTLGASPKYSDTSSHSRQIGT